jgi:hypothetical protein
MANLTENQLKAIELLATYKYLTSSQFVKMGVFKKRSYLTNSLKILIDSKNSFILKHDFNPVNGKVESLYFLTRNGKKLLVNQFSYDETKIKMPSGMATVYLHDYYHRKYTIDFHIAFRLWLESRNGVIEFLNYYFDKAGNNRCGNDHVTPLNRIQLDERTSIIPDINAKFIIEDKVHLFLFEQHNGNDTKRLFEQLYMHILAISTKAVSSKYNYKKPYKIVVVCEKSSVKDSVIQRLKKESGIEYYDSFFLFKTNDELEENFYRNWTLISGEKVDFLNEQKV